MSGRSDPHGPDASRAALAAIASLLAPAHPAVAEQVLQAHDSPHDYVRPSRTGWTSGASTSRWTTSRG